MLTVDKLPKPVCKTEGGFWARDFHVLGTVLSEATLRKYLAKIKVTPKGCWIWLGGRNSANYPNIRLNGKYLLLHRVFYELFNGPITQTDVCHECDTPPCINPAHLFQGTRVDNMQDSASKGRHWKHNTMRVKSAKDEE